MKPNTLQPLSWLLGWGGSLCCGLHAEGDRLTPPP